MRWGLEEDVLPRSELLRSKSLFKLILSRVLLNRLDYELVISVRNSLNTASRWPYISLLILRLLNLYISVKTSLINIKFGDFVDLGVLFLNMWINSC